MDPKSGGPAEWINQYGRAAQAMGHEVHTVTMDEPGSDFLPALPLETTAVGASAKGFFSAGLLAHVREHAPAYDCVIIHGLWRYTGPGTRKALLGTGVPYFVYPHGMLDPWFKETFPVKHFFKSLYWHANEYPVLRDARAVLFTSEQEKRKARMSFDRYTCNEQVLTLGIAEPPSPETIDPQAFFQAFPDVAGKPYFLFLGRIHQKKGCDLLIRGFAEAAKDSRHMLVMAGPDQKAWAAELKSLAAELGVAERIIWTGMITGDVKWSAVYNADAFTLISHQENFGIVVAEALACGVPVLITDKVDIYREIQEDGAGFVVTDNVAGAAEALAQYLALSEAEASAMRERARACYASRFEVGQATQGLLGYLQAAVQAG
jgi:glycosyltransferase involved in cell wall biosynthesis